MLESTVDSSSHVISWTATNAAENLAFALGLVRPTKELLETLLLWSSSHQACCRNGGSVGGRLLLSNFADERLLGQRFSGKEPLMLDHEKVRRLYGKKRSRDRIIASLQTIFLILPLAGFAFSRYSNLAQIKILDENLSHVLFSTKSKLNGGSHERLHSFDLVIEEKATGIQQVVSEEATVLAASLSPNGSVFVYTSISEQICIAQVSDVRNTFCLGAFSVGVSWNPNGEVLAYSKRDVDESNIFILNLKTRQEIQLTSGSGRNSSPIFSPNGDSIVFTSDRTSLASLWLFNFTTNSEIQITNWGLEAGRGRPDSYVPVPCCESAPLWSSDKLVWTSEDGVWAADLKERKAWLVYNEKGKIRWQREGEEVVVETSQGPIVRRLKP